MMPNTNPTLAVVSEGEGWAASLDDGVLHMRLANPPVNAINTAMWKIMNGVLTSIHEDDSVRVLVLTSDSPKIFSAGIDFKELRNDDGGGFGAPGDRRTLVRNTLKKYYELTVPTVVGVRGKAIGAGAVLPALADLVVGGPGTEFTAAEIDRGIVGGSRFFARLLSEPLMRKMMLLGCPVGGDELFRAGAFADYVDDDDGVVDAALALGRRLADKHPRVMRLMKQAHVEVENMAVMDGYQVEQKYSVIVPEWVRNELVPAPSK